MRQRRSDRGLDRASSLVWIVAGGVWGATFAHARTLAGQENSGGLFLVAPVAARMVGIGGAGVAATPGGEAVVSNPAGIAWLARSEGSLQYGQDVVSNRIVAVVAVPSRRYGTFGLSASLTDYGSQGTTAGDDVVSGSLYVRDVYYAASYASTLGRGVSVGLTYRYAQNRFDCTGACTNPNDPTERAPTTGTSAVDFGVQYVREGRVPLAIGAAVRHLGLRLQVLDREQSDQLPTQLSLGARVAIPAASRYVPGVDVRGFGETVIGVGQGVSGGARVGLEGIYRQAFALRAGYARGGGIGEGPAIGLGYTRRRLGFDIARQFTGLSADAGEPPTYAAIRYAF